MTPSTWPPPPGDSAPLLRLLSHNQNSCKPGQKTQFHFGFQLTLHYLRSFLLLLLLILAEQPVEYVYSSLLFTKRNTKPPIKKTYQFTLRWCFQPETLRTRGQLVLPLNKLWRVVDGFNGVFLSVPERTFFCCCLEY